MGVKDTFVKKDDDRHIGKDMSELWDIAIDAYSF